MAFSEDDLLALIETVEEQGGAHLPDAHMPETYMLDVPTKHGKKRIAVQTTGCKRETMFVIPYDYMEQVNIPVGKPESENPPAREKEIPYLERRDSKPPAGMEERYKKRGAGFLRVCAVDDAVALWPRFT